MGLEPHIFSAGSPKKTSVPPMLCSSIARLAARNPAKAPIPSAECGSVWPAAYFDTPSRGFA